MLPRWVINLLVIPLLKDGAVWLYRSISDFAARKYREYQRQKKLKKYEETGDPKDLADLEDDLNNK